MVYMTGRQKNTKRGFTLIELLVVIAIIGILMIIVYTNFEQSRKSSRDKIRQTTLVDLQLAIEQFKSQNGQYPVRGCGSATQWATNDTTLGAVNTDVATGSMSIRVCPLTQPFIGSGLSPSFISDLPSANEATGRSFMYFVNSDRTAYKLVAFNAIESTANEFTSYADTKKFAACPPQCEDFDARNTLLCGTDGPHGTTYAVYSIGGECL